MKETRSGKHAERVSREEERGWDYGGRELEESGSRYVELGDKVEEETI